MSNKPTHTRGRRAIDVHQQNRPRCHAAVAHHSGLLPKRATALAAPDQLHYPRHEQCGTGRGRIPANTRTHSVCSTGPALESKVWTLWGAAAVGRPRWSSSQPMTTSNLHMPPASLPKVVSLAAGDRPEAKPKPGVASLGRRAETNSWRKQSEASGVSVTTSPEAQASARILHCPSLLLRHILRRRGCEKVATR